MGERTERFEVDLPATPEEVWWSLTTDEGLTAWFGTRASVDARVGGERVVGWGEAVEIRGRVDVVEPGSRLRIVYTDGDDEVGAEEWLITTVGTATRLTLVHSMPDDGVDDWEGWYGDMRRGWRLFLASLRHGFAGAATPERTAECRYLSAPGSRGAIRDRLDRWRATRPADLDGLSEVLDDPPHSLLLASAARTVLVDVEGSGDDQVLYVQAATHDVVDPGWRRRVLEAAADALGP